MSRYMSERHVKLKAYTPGEQPKNREYIKLNTNESPFAPSKRVEEAVAAESRNLQLYSDPECRDLSKKTAEFFGVEPENILMTNGSDEILNFAFIAFGDSEKGFAFPEHTYGFYPVFADLSGVPYKKIALGSDFRVNVSDYENVGMNIVIANPNAPTGLVISLEEIERIVKTNTDSVVIIDEAYVDFGTESAVGLTKKYDNLLVTRTFSKSYSLAGARLGFGIGNKELIADLNKIKYSTNPYNVNRMTMAAGIAALEDAKYYRDNCDTIIRNREAAKEELRALGFTVTDSKANFIFAAHRDIGGKELYLKLKERGILVRHFDTCGIEDYNRITVGTAEQMGALIEAIKQIMKEG